MRKRCIALITALFGASFSLAHAADDSLYRAFGGKPGMASLMSDFADRLKTDDRIGRYFKDVKAAALAESLTEQICQLSGGPCTYEGAPMNKSHQDMGVDRAAFNRLVEVLQDAMEARGIAFGDQNRLLARLAPMHRDIVTR
jgi:hemoglobin